MSASRRGVGLAAAVVALCAPLSASSAVSPDSQAATPSTGTIVTVGLPRGACAQQRMSAVITVTDRQRRPLARAKVVIRAGTWITPASGLTAATGKVTLRIFPVPFRRGPLTLAVTATPPGRAAVTKQVPLPAC